MRTSTIENQNPDPQTDSQPGSGPRDVLGSQQPQSELDNQPPTLNQPAAINSQLCTSATEDQLPALNSSASSPRKIRRNGRIACLPRIQRDMVNHMLWNAVPYKNIVAALGEACHTVTERNISNWAMGGYLEWSLAQEHVLQNRLDQDHMLDFLRRDDAPELPEVGLQAAATRLSQVLLQKLARADDPEAQLDNYSRLVDLLCRLNREIVATQKQRDDSRLTLGPEYDPVRVNEEEQISAIQNERLYSNPPPDSGLPRPSVPPALPPIPTAHILAEQAREDRQEAQIQHRRETMAMLKAVRTKSDPVTPTNRGPSTIK